MYFEDVLFYFYFFDECVFVVYYIYIDAKCVMLEQNLNVFIYLYFLEIWYTSIKYRNNNFDFILRLYCKNHRSKSQIEGELMSSSQTMSMIHLPTCPFLYTNCKLYFVFSEVPMERPPQIPLTPQHGTRLRLAHWAQMLQYPHICSLGRWFNSVFGYSFSFMKKKIQNIIVFWSTMHNWGLLGYISFEYPCDKPFSWGNGSCHRSGQI